MGTSTGVLPDPVAGRVGTKRWNVLGMSAELGQISFSNSTLKHSELTLRGYSRIEWW